MVGLAGKRGPIFYFNYLLGYYKERGGRRSSKIKLQLLLL